MANTNAPFGFQYVGTQIGVTPNVKLTTRKIASNNSTAIYRGDPVSALNTGYVAQWSSGTVVGIFHGCKYLSTTLGRTVWSNYWPGSGATGDIEAYIIDDPNALFKVQAGGAATAIGFGDIGTNADPAVGTGSALTQLSGAYLDQTSLATTAKAFRVMDLVQDPPGANGTDITSGYNHVIVMFNNQSYRTTTGV